MNLADLAVCKGVYPLMCKHDCPPEQRPRLAHTLCTKTKHDCRQWLRRLNEAVSCAAATGRPPGP